MHLGHIVACKCQARYRHWLHMKAHFSPKTSRQPERINTIHALSTLIHVPITSTMVTPSTPSRRHGSVSLCRTPTRRGLDLPLTSTPRKNYNGTPLGHLRSGASPSYSDRYIPSRSNMNINLISSNIQSAEKRRLELTPRVLERQHSLRMGIVPLQSSHISSPPSSHVAQTAEQASFHRAMGAALHELPLENFEDVELPETNPVAISQSRPISVNGSLVSIISPNLQSDVQRVQSRQDLSFIAYASIAELEEEVNENLPSLTAFEQRSRGPKRTFRYNCSDDTRSVRPRIDPFQHNHHHVLQRSAALNGEAEYADKPTSTKISKRKIAEKPTKVLDAPDIVDDYYLNLISWSKDNILAVAMGPSVYLWNATSGEIGHVVTLSGANDYVSSVSWSTIPGSTKYLAIGTHSNSIQLWDTQEQKLVRKLNGHSNRVSAMTWNSSKNWLTSGGRDSQILQHDVRVGNHIVGQYKGHRQEVCGLSWNEDGHALASGGNENYLCIWDAAMSRRNTGRQRVLQDADAVTPRFLLTQHKAAVKALDWCPFNRSLLASGGGTADRTIKFWNAVSGTVTNSIDTGSQVCSIVWSKHQRELCSSHGFSENQLILWRYPTMTKVQEFKSHTARVLNMEMSPDGRSVVSVGADETLRFWDIFGPPPQSKRRENFLIGDFHCPGTATIR